jgi:hypothetical protein
MTWEDLKHKATDTDLFSAWKEHREPPATCRFFCQLAKAAFIFSKEEKELLNSHPCGFCMEIIEEHLFFFF